MRERVLRPTASRYIFKRNKINLYFTPQANDFFKS